MYEILIFGVSGTTLPAEQLKRIQQCTAVVVSRRQRHLVNRIAIDQIAIAPIKEMLFSLAVALEQGDVAVLASGDPLFFGIGRTLLDRFGAERLRIFPALSAVQLACARFKIPWDDLLLLSLHGREPGELAGRILPHARVLLFTDHRNSPNRVAAELMRVLQKHRDSQRLARIRVRVAENLALDDEQLSIGSLAEIAGRNFSALNMMLIEQEKDENKPADTALPAVFGLRETEISHSRGLITKDEIRAVILHCLRLPKKGVFWDVGGGSGSISVEAARLCPDLDIYTIEQKEEGQENIRANIVRHNLYNIHLICGQAPAGLEDLPDPDRIFIGGSSGLLAEIIHPCAERLHRYGKMVASAVLARTAEQAPRLMARNGLTVDIRTVAVSRYSLDAEQEKTVLNPITIISGSKEKSQNNSRYHAE
jgi:precorrin-6Y C5,15-methyltransferase (decarboxylating)